MAVQVYNQLLASQQAGAVRAVQLIRDQGVLGRWMAEQVDQPLLAHNTQHFHLPLNMGYDSHKEPQIHPQLLDLCILSGVRVE